MKNNLLHNKLKSIRLVVFLCLAASITLIAANTAEAKKKAEKQYDPEFVQFLKDFQAAVKSGDVNRIADMCQFPLLEKWKYYEPVPREEFLSNYTSHISKQTQKWVRKLKPGNFENCEEFNNEEDPSAGTYLDKNCYWCAMGRPGSDNEEDNFFIEIKKIDGVFRVFSLI